MIGITDERCRAITRAFSLVAASMERLAEGFRKAQKAVERLGKRIDEIAPRHGKRRLGLRKQRGKPWK